LQKKKIHKVRHVVRKVVKGKKNHRVGHAVHVRKVVGGVKKNHRVGHAVHVPVKKIGKFMFLENVYLV